MTRRFLAVFAALCALIGGRAARAAETAALAPDAPWRVFLTCSQQERHGRNPAAMVTAPPPAGWMNADFDDSGWGRYGADWAANVGGYGFEMASTSSMLCMRTHFGIADPSAARDLTLTLEYRGGIVVYVNGQEITRQHLPKDKLDAQARADEYPPESFVDAAGAALPQADRPATENADRYEKRIRKLDVAVPSALLRKGANALAVQLHQAPPSKAQAGGRAEWSRVGLCSVKLISKSGAGVAAYADALRGVTVSNATPMDTISNAPGKRQSGFLWSGITITPVGLTRANPFEPLRPIRAVAPRGGTCSGQVVVSGPGPMSGLKASLSPLKAARGGASIPADAVRIAYASQDKDEVFCNALLPAPVDGAAVQPVWVLVDVPRNQTAGWYTGTLSVSAGATKADVPVHVLVSPWTLTDPKDNATLVSMYQSPDTLAAHFKAEPWSDRHFALIEQSMRTMAPAGNDVVLVPVVLDNYLYHKNGMVRWVRKGGRHEPEFAALERYLDVQTRVFGKPKVVTLSVWKHDFGTRTWFRGMKSETVKPCMVTELDPATGKMAPMQAPHFGEPGSEAFWTPMFEGVRKLIKARGIDDRFLLLGEAFDSRPLEKHLNFLKKIQPDMRWQIYSHFDGGEPPPKDGKFICHGGFEVGFRINPNGGSLPEFARDYPNPKAPVNEFLLAQVQRTLIHHTSSPLSYRVVMGHSGTIARIGLDFWPIMTDERGRRRSYYGCPPNEGWLWRGHVPSLTAAGPDGGVRTTRAQMFLEGLQESELHILIMRAKQKASPELAARIEKYFAGRRDVGLVGATLSQAAISLDFSAMAASAHALGAQLAGEAGEDEWPNRPQAQ